MTGPTFELSILLQASGPNWPDFSGASVSVESKNVRRHPVKTATVSTETDAEPMGTHSRATARPTAFSLFVCFWRVRICWTKSWMTPYEYWYKLAGADRRGFCPQYHHPPHAEEPLAKSLSEMG